MKKVVKGFASVILASMFVFIGCNQTTGGSNPPGGGSGSKPTGQSKITITVKGDERIDPSPLQIEKPYNTKWSDIKAEIKGKIKPTADWKDDWNKGDYAVYEWRLGDENGEKISDDYRFTDKTTVYAVSNYMKWTIVSNELRGYKGSKPRGKIIIPDSVTSIGEYAFLGCSKLASITIPNGVTSIEEETFSGCSGLTSITISEGVTSIGSCAFSDCTRLKSITIPEGVTSIGYDAFRGCSKLKTITLPEGVKSIGETAFFKCTGLASITIPKSVKSIGDYAFDDCNLTSATFKAPYGWRDYSYSVHLVNVSTNEEAIEALKKGGIYKY